MSSSDIVNKDIESQETKQILKSSTKPKKESTFICGWVCICCIWFSCISICSLLFIYSAHQVRYINSYDEKEVIIYNSYLNGADTIICSNNNPCYMRCEEYIEETGIRLDECNVPVSLYVALYVSIAFLILCIVVTVKEICSLCLGRLCYKKPSEQIIPSTKKNNQKTYARC